MPEPLLGTKKDFDPKDPNPCSGCSQCCEYLALEIDTPTTAKDFDQIIWFLIHKDVWVYLDHDNSWNIQFNTPCEKLENSRCSYYENRPLLCREYEVDACPRYGEDEDCKFLFKNETDLFRYLSEKRPATFKKIKEKINIPDQLLEILN